MSVVLEAILPDPEGDDVAYAAGEWVRLRNLGDGDVDLSGWLLVDVAGHRLRLPDGTRIRSGGTLRLHPGPGVSDAERIFFGYRAAVINNSRERLELRTPAGEVASSLGTTGGLAFDPQVAWPSELRLLYAGDDPLGFGPTTNTARVRLAVPGGPDHDLTGALQSSSLIVARLPGGMVPGWYDVALTVRDLTGSERTALRPRVPFAVDQPALIVLDPERDPPEWSFGEAIRVRVARPLGTRLRELGVTTASLRPKLVRVDGGSAITGFGQSELVEDAITLRLPRSPYPGYSPHQAEHRLDPGIPAGTLNVVPEGLPTFNLVPLPLEEGQVRALLEHMFTVVPAAPQLDPGATPQWAIGTRPSDEVRGIPGMSDEALAVVKNIVYGSGATVEVRCTLSAAGEPAGERWTSDPTVSESGPRAPRGFSYSAEFGLLRPLLRRHSGAPAQPADGFEARLAVKATVRGLPAPLPAAIEADVPVAAPVVQLPLLVPTLAVFADQKYEHAFLPPGNRLLVLVDGMPSLIGDAVFSTPLAPARTEEVALVLTAALRLLRSAIPAVDERFPGFPAAAGLPPRGSNADTGLDLLARWLGDPRTEITITGIAAAGDIGRGQFSGHPGWWDAPSAAFMVGLEGGGLKPRKLRVFSEPDGTPENSAYLDMQVPAGHVVACLWTLHESLFTSGFGPRAPFGAVTQPHPKKQYDDAETHASRVNMPHFFLKGSTFGNVINGFEWGDAKSTGGGGPTPRPPRPPRPPVHDR